MTDDRRIALLAAALATLLAEAEETAVDPSAAAWSRTGHPHARSWAWNPRSPGHAWRLAARLCAHQGAWHGRST